MTRIPPAKEMLFQILFPQDGKGVLIGVDTHVLVPPTNRAIILLHLHLTQRLSAQRQRDGAAMAGSEVDLRAILLSTFRELPFEPRNFETRAVGSAISSIFVSTVPPLGS